MLSKRPVIGPATPVRPGGTSTESQVRSEYRGLSIATSSGVAQAGSNGPPSSLANPTVIGRAVSFRTAT